MTSVIKAKGKTMQADQIPNLDTFEMRLTSLENAVSSVQIEVDSLGATVSLKADVLEVSNAIASAHTSLASEIWAEAPEVRAQAHNGVSPIEQRANDEARHGNRNALEARTDSERIVAAAIFHGATISLPAPARHHTVLNFMATTMGLDTALIHPVNQGFLTSKGRFVNRTEAFYIADRMGQIIEKTGNQGEPTLYSEDLW